MTTQAPLNEAQLTLLRLFSRPMDDKEILALRAMLIEFYERSLQEELDRVIDEKEIQQRIGSIANNAQTSDCRY